MRKIEMQGKTLVFWGVGQISKQGLEVFPEIQPAFYIDSNADKMRNNEKQIKNPNQIEDWSSLFVNIVVKNNDEIKTFLREKGLVEGKDFMDYVSFYDVPKVKSVEEFLTHISNWITDNPEYYGAAVWFAPITESRMVQTLEFIKKHYKEKKVIIVAPTKWLSEQEMCKKLGIQVFYAPETIAVLKRKKEQLPNYLDELTLDEAEYVCHLREECSEDDTLDNVFAGEYYFCKKFMEIVKPSEVLFWGGWSIRNYMLKETASRCGIPNAFSEFGELPGTIKFDPEGIEGKGLYAQYPEELKRISVTEQELRLVEKIKTYITETKIDSITFKNAPEERSVLENRNRNRKSILLIGMDDNGKEIDRGSVYWNEYLSSAFKSSKEAANSLCEICNRNEWNLFVKPHPYTKFYVEETEFVHEFFELEIDQLIQNVDAVVSITSKADYKTLIYEKPLIQIGQTSLTGKGCGYEVTDKTQLEGALIDALENGMTEEQKNNFDIHLAQLLKVSLWDDGGERPLRYGQSLEKSIWG